MYIAEIVFILVALCQSMTHLETFSIDNSSWKAKHLKGRFTRDVKEYEVTVPSKLSSEGKFLSYSLPHFYKRDTERRRERRSTDEAVHYGLAIGGQEYVVELHPSRGLMSPGLMVEKRSGGSLQDANIYPASSEQCHYTGWIRGNRNTTRAAISVCQSGMVGYVKTSDGRRHFVEPVADHHPESDGRHLHMVYEDPQKTREKRNCGTGDDWEPAWRDRLTRERRRYSETEASLKRDVEERLQHVRHVLRHPLKKRTVHSEHRYLEILVVADKRFVEYHNNPDRENYILTIMNMSNDFYHDASVGNLIDFVVVRIMYLEKEEEEIDLVINRDAENTLDSFCKWQIKINPKDISHPNHHDIAVLLTRYDICSDNVTECGLLGLAFTAEACDTTHSCCINEDTGLTLGVVVTHEVGHVLGCAHDEPEFSGCEPYSDPEKHFSYVMSPYVQLATNIWSSCSRGFITEFLDNNLGNCLLDEPQEHSFSIPKMPPGAMYDIAFQCRQKFGPNSKPCKRGPKETCEKLWCTMGDTDECGTYGKPPADGTKCAENMWCFERQCVEIGARPAAVDGGWAEWGPYSECSRTCGGGVSFSERDCTNPVPQNHGRYCTGEKRRYVICNTAPCDMGQPSFKAAQCAEHDSKPYKDKLHHWIPFKGEPDSSCKLVCCNEDNVCRTLAARVKDATPCKPGSRDMCIAGACRKVGCDWVMDSDAVEDECGICNGDGADCKIIEGTFTEKGGNDYEKIITIPAGATKIFVEELKPSSNTLAVSDESGKKFYLNGDYREETDGERNIAGSVSIYMHPEPDKEMLAINGPLQNSIILYLCFFDENNPGVSYKYAMPNEPGETFGTQGPEISMEPVDIEISYLTSTASKPGAENLPDEVYIPIMTSSAPELGIGNKLENSKETIEIPIFTSKAPEPEEEDLPEISDVEIPMITASEPEYPKETTELPSSTSETNKTKSKTKEGTGGEVINSVNSGQASGRNSNVSTETTTSTPSTTEANNKTKSKTKEGLGGEMTDTATSVPASGRNSDVIYSQNNAGELGTVLEPKYSWEFLEWGECSVKCGGGVQMSDPSCVEERGGRVSNSFCEQLQKPEPMARICNTEPCKAHWKTSGWSECQGRLHQKGCRSRNVKCVKQSPALDLEVVTDDKECPGKKPEAKEVCTVIKACQPNESQAHNTSHKTTLGTTPTVKTTEVTVVPKANKKSAHLSDKVNGNKHVKRRNIHIMLSFGGNDHTNTRKVAHGRSKFAPSFKIINNNEDAITCYKQTGKYHHKNSLSKFIPQKKAEMMALDEAVSVRNEHNFAENANDIAEARRARVPQHTPNTNRLLDAELAALSWKHLNQPLKSLRGHKRRAADSLKQMYSTESKFDVKKSQPDKPETLNTSIEENVPRSLNNLHTHKRRFRSKAYNRETSLKAAHKKIPAIKDNGISEDNSINPLTLLHKAKARVFSKYHLANKRRLRRQREKLRSPFAIQRGYVTNGKNNNLAEEECVEEKQNPKVAINKADIGKLVKDRVPKDEFQLEIAPKVEKNKTLDLSDETNELLGDMVSDFINTKNDTNLQGKQTEEVEKHLTHGENRTKLKRGLHQ